MDSDYVEYFGMGVYAARTAMADMIGHDVQALIEELVENWLPYDYELCCNAEDFLNKVLT